MQRKVAGTEAKAEQQEQAALALDFGDAAEVAAMAHWVVGLPL